VATLKSKVLRIACDISSDEPTLDSVVAGKVVFWRGAEARVQCAMFKGTPSLANFITDITDILSIDLVVRKHSQKGAVIISKTLLKGTDIVASTFAAWQDGSGQQFTFVVTDSDTSAEVPSSGVLPLHWTLVGTTASTSFIIARGFGFLNDIGLVDLVPPTLPGGYVELTVTAAGVYNVVPVRSQMVLKITAEDGVVPYTFTIVLTTANLLPGALVDLLVVMKAGTTQQILVRNATSLGGTLYIANQDSDNDHTEHVIFRLSNALAWEKYGGEITQ
jgi:hypothetical protein